MIGKTINNYVIERSLGEGGMGNVYLARHNRVDRLVAIKILHQHLFSNNSIRHRFKNEANALIKLEHPNIVKIYDYVEQEDFACLVMEYISGYTLDEYIARVSGPLISAKALNLFTKILDAVQYAHDNKIYHRDIKPGNIMISRDGSVIRIMDFGIAKIIDSENFKATKANAQLGTPFYMSPEQVKGLKYTASSDIYSLGVTLFEMVTGKCPYQAITNLFELQSKIVNEPLPPTALYYPEVSGLLQAAIKKATEKNPSRRFKTCAEFKQFLQTNIESPVLPVPPDREIIRPGKPVRKKEPAIDRSQAKQPQKAEEVAKISFPHLLQSYPQKEKKNYTWVYLVGLLFFVSLIIVLYNKEKEILTDPPGQPDSSTTGVNKGSDWDSAVVADVKDTTTDLKDKEPQVITDNTVAVPEPKPIVAVKEKKPVFNKLTARQVIGDIRREKLQCGDESYSGKPNQTFTSASIPSEDEQVKMKNIRLSVKLTDKITNITNSYQLFYEKTGNAFKYTGYIDN